MSNSSSSSSSSANTHLVSTIADSLLEWVQKDIFPVCVATFDSLAIVVGLILNILLLVTFRKRGLFNEPSTHFVLMLIIVDFVAYLLLLLFNVIAAGMSDWKLSQPMCEIHGAMFDVLMFANFSFVTVLCIERGIKLCNPDLYERFFTNKKCVIIVTVIVWVVSTLVGFIPVTGAGDVRYDFYHQGCMLDYTRQHIFLIVHFIVVICIPLVLVIITYALIFETRRKAILESREDLFKKVRSEEKQKLTSNTSSTSGEPKLATISENEEEEDGVFRETPSKPGSAKKSPQQAFEKKGSNDTKARPKSSSKQSLLFEVFSDDHENPAFHLALTYLALWGTLFICYLPYFIVFFIGTYNMTLWGGFYTVTLLVSHVSFVVKPVVYLGHNRHYRLVTKETVPEAVKKRARSVRNSISSIGNQVEDFVFKSNANKQFRAALTAQRAVLIWKKKLNKKKNVFKLKNTNNANTDVKAVSVGEKPNNLPSDSDTVGSSSNPANTTGAFNKNINSHSAPYALASDPTRSLPTTPSGIAITASSFIERERQKLTNLNNASSPKAPLDGGHGSAQDNSPVDAQRNNDVPGMVYDTLFDRKNATNSPTSLPHV